MAVNSIPIRVSEINVLCFHQRDMLWFTGAIAKKYETQALPASSTLRMSIIVRTVPLEGRDGSVG